MYEKFINCDTVDSSTVYHDSNAFESREVFTFGERADWEYVNILSMKSISLEEDDPFGDIGEGMDDGPADSGGDVGGMDDSDPFGGIGGDDGGFDFDSADDSSGDIFGSDDSGGDDQREQQKALLLDRAKSIKEDFDISRQIRANFPKKFLEMKEILLGNIDKMERSMGKVDHQYEDVLRGMIVECERMYELIEAYISVMAKKPYEDIFATYVSIHTSMVRLKNLYIKITGLDAQDVELEESKYDDTI